MNQNGKRDFISVIDFTREEVKGILGLAKKLKENRGLEKDALLGKSVGLIFEKPSNRTRLSFEVGIYQLGGNAIYLGTEDIQLGVREEVKDIARVLSRYLDAIVARTHKHEHLMELAKFSTIPVINALSDLLHPCQALCDIFTIYEKLGDVGGVKICFVGDGNNVLHSLIFACAVLGMDINVATPKDYQPNKNVLEMAFRLAKKSGSSIMVGSDPKKAASGCDVVYTDVWVSMGKEHETKKRLKAFKGFQVDKKLVSLAKKDALIMHCLPAHRGEEIQDEVMEGRNSVVFDQAENKLHIVKAILLKLLT